MICCCQGITAEIGNGWEGEKQLQNFLGDAAIIEEAKFSCVDEGVKGDGYHRHWSSIQKHE